jgi:nucleoside-triphosphate--adenylate kinase
MASKLRLIVLGAPGSGKGTISSRLVKEFRLSHLSSGDLLRSNIQNKTDIGLKAKDLVAQGKLLPDEFITRVVLQELIKLSDKGWLLDGYPRTLSQAQALDTATKSMHIDRVINLNVPFEVIVNRLKHRWVHPPSGRVYNDEFNPPRVPRKDDVTGDPLIQRPDDSESVVLSRLKIYESQTKPLIDFYTAKNKLVTFTGNTSDYLWPLIKANVATLNNTELSKLNTVQPNSDFIETVTHTGNFFCN